MKFNKLINSLLKEETPSREDRIKAMDSLGGIISLQEFNRFVNALPDHEKKIDLDEYFNGSDECIRVDIKDTPITIEPISQADSNIEAVERKRISFGVITDVVKQTEFNSNFKRTDNPDDYFYLVKIIKPCFPPIYYPQSHQEAWNIMDYIWNEYIGTEWAIYGCSSDMSRIEMFVDGVPTYW